MVDGECDDNDESQDEAQDKGQGLLKTLPLVRDALVGCNETKGRKRSRSPVSDCSDGGSGSGGSSTWVYWGSKQSNLLTKQEGC